MTLGELSIFSVIENENNNNNYSRILPKPAEKKLSQKMLPQIAKKTRTIPNTSFNCREKPKI